VAAPSPDPESPDGREDVLLEAYMARRASLVRFFAARAGSNAAAEDLVQH